jgi:prepilin-type N-terminal cleavage/methylation domain-containing protein
MKKRNGIFRNQKGFTLIELMIVIIIIGILAAVGVPLYMGYIRDAKVASAQATIGVIQNSEKIYNQKYGSFKIVDLTTAPNDLNIDVRDAMQNWTLKITAATDTTFTITAVGVAGTEYSTIEVDLDYDMAKGQTWTKKENGTPFS